MDFMRAQDCHVHGEACVQVFRAQREVTEAQGYGKGENEQA